MELLFRNRRRSFAHGINRILCLRECYDIADRLAFEHEHDHAVQTESQSSVGRSTVFKGTDEEAEFLFYFFRCQANRLEHALLDIRLINTKRTATQFNTIKYQVIRLSIYMSRVSFQFIQVFIPHSRERMMHGNIAMFFFAVFKHGEIDNPGKSKFIFVDKIHAAGHFLTQFTESSRYDFRLIGNHED